MKGKRSLHKDFLTHPTSCLAGRTYSTQHFTTSAFPYNSTHALISCQCQILNKSVLLACYYYSHPVLKICQLTFSYATLLSRCCYWLWMLSTFFKIYSDRLLLYFDFSRSWHGCVPWQQVTGWWLTPSRCSASDSENPSDSSSSLVSAGQIQYICQI